MNYRIVLFLITLCHPLANINPAEIPKSPPLPPVLKNVTVNNSTASATLTWAPAPSPGITGYVVYRYRNNEGYAIDTLRDPSILTFTDYSTGALFFSESYVVAAIDNEANISPLSNSMNTIFLKGVLDTCNLKLNFEWNPFNTSGTEITGYDIMVSTGGNDYGTIHTTDPGITNFYWEDFDFHQEYRVMIKALMSDGSSSESNSITLQTNLQRPPAWIETGYVSVVGNESVMLSVEYDPMSETERFNIMRKRGDEAYYTLLNEVISSGGTFLFTDNSANPAVRYIYRVDAVNNCGTSVISSTPAPNIVLENKTENFVITLNWNAYSGWSDGLYGYKVYYNTGGTFEAMSLLSDRDTILTTDYRSFMYDISGNEVCFRIKAMRYATETGEYESLSNTLCLETTENVYVPTAFTPDDNGLNDLFKPVMPFTPSTYDLIIRERNGRLIFRSSDFNEAWDGTFRGQKLPPDVYLWHLKLQSPSGRIIEKRGSVALIYNN